LIFSGDFYQLPPVGDNSEPDTQRFCFESDDWNSVFHTDNQIELKKIFRQNDEIYSTILNQIREGKIKRKSREHDEIDLEIDDKRDQEIKNDHPPHHN
jgi:ATP-dependent DNA helicase PIF1